MRSKVHLCDVDESNKNCKTNGMNKSSREYFQKRSVEIKENKSGKLAGEK